MGVSPTSTFFTDCLSPASAFYFQGQPSTASTRCRVLSIDYRSFQSITTCIGCTQLRVRHIAICQGAQWWRHEFSKQTISGSSRSPIDSWVHYSRQPVFQAAQKWLTNQFCSATWLSAPVTREFSLASSLSIKQDSSDYQTSSESSLSVYRRVPRSPSALRVHYGISVSHSKWLISSVMVRRGSVWCGVAQLVARRLAGRQARVRFPARHHREIFPTEPQAMRRWREVSANVLYECDWMIILYECYKIKKNKQKRVAYCHQTF